MKRIAWVVNLVGCIGLTAVMLFGQSLYQLVEGWGQLPDMEWGAASSVYASGDPVANVLVFRRATPTTIELTPDGKFVRSWGDNGMYRVAHSIDIDKDGNVWTTDSADHVVYKFDKDGKLLLTLGERGVSGDDSSHDHFNRPSDVAVSREGDVFVTDGYANSRVVRFDKDGKFKKILGGTKGSAPGQFNLPHALVFDSQQRLLIADRENERIVIMSQDGEFLGEWKGLSKPSGLAITPDDTIYVSDVDAGTVTIAKDGKVIEVIGGLGRPHNVAVDARGNIYTANPGNKGVRKVAKK